MDVHFHQRCLFYSSALYFFPIHALNRDFGHMSLENLEMKISSEKEDKLPIGVMFQWRKSLENLLLLYEIYRPNQRFFVLKLFVFFVVVNVICYWIAIGTAFPFLLVSPKANEYVLLQFPVGIMGATFDTLSFFATVWIARNALNSIYTWQFVLHLSLDLFIAFLATMWVVLVFVLSGWALSFLLGNPEVLGERSSIYQGRLLQALLHPFQNMRNIYFGLTMGFSAGLPSFVHVLLFGKAVLHQMKRKRVLVDSQS